MMQQYWRQFDSPKPDLSKQYWDIFAFTLPGAPPEWMTNTNGALLLFSQFEECSMMDLLNFRFIGDLNPGFKEICRVRADLNGLRGLLVKRMGVQKYYWTLNYKVGIRFGGTELEAFIEWEKKV
jgi:hypothetical protein